MRGKVRGVLGIYHHHQLKTDYLVSTLNHFQRPGLDKNDIVSVVTDLLMSEAVRYYTRDTRVRKETSEDSGVESGHSIENHGKKT